MRRPFINHLNQDTVMVNLWLLLRSAAQLPFEIQKEIGVHHLKRIMRQKSTRHQVIWTSFLYYFARKPFSITEKRGLYFVNFESGDKRVGTNIRIGRSSDIFVFFQVFIVDGYKPLVDFMKGKSFTPRTIVDVGANVGYFSVLMSSQYPHAEISCVEPSSKNYDCLKINMGENAKSVQLIEAALWTSDRKLMIKNESAEEWAFQLTDNSLVPGEYDGISLTSLIRKLGISRIDLLKMDIEGAEGILFNDLNFLAELDKVTILAMEIHDEHADRKRIHEKLSERGFKYFEQGELTVAFNVKWLGA